MIGTFLLYDGQVQGLSVDGFILQVSILAIPKYMFNRVTQTEYETRISKF